MQVWHGHIGRHAADCLVLAGIRSSKSTYAATSGRTSGRAPPTNAATSWGTTARFERSWASWATWVYLPQFTACRVGRPEFLCPKHVWRHVAEAWWLRSQKAATQHAHEFPGMLSMAPSDGAGNLQALPPAYWHAGAQCATLLSSKSAAIIELDVDFFAAAFVALFFDFLRLGKKDGATSLTFRGGPCQKSVANKIGGAGSVIYRVAMADGPEALELLRDRGCKSVGPWEQHKLYGGPKNRFWRPTHCRFANIAWAWFANTSAQKRCWLSGFAFRLGFWWWCDYFRL